MTDELKPVRCGCGGEAQVLEPSYTNCYVVQCGKCGIRTPYMNTDDEAITAWNRAMGNRDELSRVERTAKPKKGAYDLTRCECGMPVSSNFDYCPKCLARLEWE